MLNVLPLSVPAVSVQICRQQSRAVYPSCGIVLVASLTSHLLPDIPYYMYPHSISELVIPPHTAIVTASSHIAVIQLLCRHGDR